MTTYTISIRNLKAVALFAPKGVSPRCLNGVAVNRGHLVATDKIAVLAIPEPSLSKGHAEFIIPTSLVESFLLEVKVQRCVGIVATITVANDEVTLTSGKVSESAYLIDEVYPDWLSSIPPAGGKHIPGQYNWTTLAKFETAGQILAGADHPGFVGLGYRGNEPARITLTAHPDVKGMIMPYKIGGGEA